MNSFDIDSLATAFGGLTDDELRRLAMHKGQILCGTPESRTMFRSDGKT